MAFFGISGIFKLSIELECKLKSAVFWECFSFFQKGSLSIVQKWGSKFKKTCWFKIICKINDFEFSCCFDCGQLSVGSMNAIDCCCGFILFFAVIVCGIVLQLKIWNQPKTTNWYVIQTNDRMNAKMVNCIWFVVFHFLSTKNWVWK